MQVCERARIWDNDRSVLAQHSVSGMLRSASVPTWRAQTLTLAAAENTPSRYYSHAQNSPKSGN